jgi:hypothetical protein
VEAAVFLAAVPLGGHHDTLGRVARHRALDQEDVGLLAGLQHAEVGVEGGLAGHHPGRPWLGASTAALDLEPGGPALVVVLGFVDGVEVEDEGGV